MRVMIMVAASLSLDTAPATVATLPGFLPCAPEGQVCSFDGTATVAYGTGPDFTYKAFANSALCDSMSLVTINPPGPLTANRLKCSSNNPRVPSAISVST